MGQFELNPGATSLDSIQVDLIKRHLNMVFVHEIDPSMGFEEHQQALTAAHEGFQAIDPSVHAPAKQVAPPRPRPKGPNSGIARC